jgi:NADH-quinone oxidoreductase subunit F
MLDTILDRYAGRRREALLPVLWKVQTAYGHIDADAVHQISHTLHVPQTEIYGVIEFYTLFYSQPTGERIIRVCTDPSCGLAHSDDVLDSLCQRLNINHGGTTPDGKFKVEHSPCLGMCEHAPAVLVSERGVGEIAYGSVRDADSLLNGLPESHYETVTRSDINVLLTGHAETLVDYGDYAALRQAIDADSPADLIQTIEDSGLIGRGGAAFPTGLKWKFTRSAPGTPKYVVANADESEPGTFKDRVLMEQRPHLLLEGMAICGFAVGAETGYLFIRGEYPYATQQLYDALHEAYEAGLLGHNMMGTDRTFNIEIRRGGGAYICGEETALFEAIEGKRGFPRIKPPYPTTHGLFGKPTTVNNVETLCAVPGIVSHGADWFRGFGTEGSTGPKLVSVSGHVHQPGVFEIEPGITLQSLLNDFCGGVVGKLQAVLMGGAAGTFLTPDDLDVKLTFEDLRAAGSTFGSGAIMVFNDGVDMRDVLVRLARFFQHESCGKCFPCQLGTQRQLEILARPPQPGDDLRLTDIGVTMTEASLCGLGQTAASAILSAMQKELV